MALLELDNIDTYYGRVHALHGISLHIDEGEIVSLIGSNGAGKTTTLRTISGLTPASKGQVRMRGKDITRLPPDEVVRLGIGHVPEGRRIFGRLTVRDNLFLAVRGVARGRYGFLRPRAAHPSRPATEDLLRRVRLEAVADQLVSSLSHGQQRQLEIGMALAGAPRFILFDEPAAGLSPGERRELVALLGALPAHMSFIIIEHDLDVALRVVEQVTVMHDGHVLKHGTPAEIEGDADVQAIYIGGARH